MWGKGQLTDFGRKQLMQQIDNIYRTKEEEYTGVMDMYGNRAVKSGIDPTDISRNYKFGSAKKQVTQPKQPPAPAQQETKTTPDGKNWVRGQDGNWHEVSQ